MESAPYTVQSFIGLANSENRRGKDISRLDPEVGKATRALRAARQRYLRNIKNHPEGSAERFALRDTYRSLRLVLRNKRDDAVAAAMRNALREFERNFREDQFSFGLTAGPTIGGKPTFQIASSLSITYPAKQATESLRRAVDAQTTSRNSVVRALRSALDKPYHHAVIKMDIERFFESIDHESLRDKVSTAPSIDRISAALIARLLYEYEILTGSRVGVPRGVGISSYAAELFMSEFDSTLRSHPGVLFYARYVDDIVIVCESVVSLARVKDAAFSALAALRLTPSASKTYERIANDEGDYPPGETLEYLGYSFSRVAGRLSAGLTTKRKTRRIERLELSFQQWLSSLPNSTWPNHGHNGMLIDRIRYLAGNTKLLNSKSNVAIGLYFSNSALDEDAPELRELDGMIRAFCTQHSSKMPDKLRLRIEAISFVEMFRNKTFLRFDQKKVEQIVAIWEHVR